MFMPMPPRSWIACWPAKGAGNDGNARAFDILARTVGQSGVRPAAPDTSTPCAYQKRAQHEFKFGQGHRRGGKLTQRETLASRRAYPYLEHFRSVPGTCPPP